MVKDWREEFDKRFPKQDILDSPIAGSLAKNLNAQKELIKSFIASLLQAEREEIEEIIKENGHQQEDGTVWCDMDKILSLIRNR